MLVRILVQKEVIKPASPKKTDTGKEIPGEFWPEGYQFWCLDASNPPEHRMEETFYYKLKPEEKDIYWGKAVDKVMTVAGGVKVVKTGRFEIPHRAFHG